MAKLTHAKRPLLKLADIEAVELKWLWYPYIPYNQATLLFGPGGIGKSSITCAVAAALSRGLPLPGQTKAGPPQKVLILSAEDDAASILRPRLEAAGADLDRVFVPDETFVLDEQGIKDLEDDMAECAATFVIIDPVVFYMGTGRDMNKMNEVRSLMGPLQKAAQQSGSAIVIVHHSRKAEEGDDALKAAGSADFVNAVRSALFVTKTPGGDPILKHVKHNYSPAGMSYLFTMEDGVFEWGDPIDTSDWGPAPTAGGSMHAGRGGREKDVAVSFLKTVLKDGPAPAKEIEALAEDQKIAIRTLNRAKVGVAESYAHREDGKLIWYWRLL